MKYAFNEVIHAPTRLAICAMLTGVEALEFGVIRDELGVSDSVVSKHLKALAGAGYIGIESKTDNVSKRPRSWVALSDAGRDAFSEYVVRMKQLIAGESPNVE